MAVSSSLAVAGAEVFVRGALTPDSGGGGDDAWYQRYRRMNETIYMRSAQDGLIYEPRPSSSVEMEYGVAGFDALGRRGDGTPPAPLGDRTHVALMGDSLAWSELVSVQDSLAVQLEDALGRASHSVSNFGVTGYDTAQEAIYYEHRVRPHAPRVVVVVYCLNDLYIASGPLNPFATAAELSEKDAQDRWFDSVARVRRETLDGVAQSEERDATIRLFARVRAVYRRATFESQYIDEVLIAGRDPERLARMRASLTRLGAAILSDGATPILVISPLLEKWDDYRWGAVHAAVRAAGEAAGFSVHDPLAEWQRTTTAEALRSPGDNLHYGPHGNRVLAEFTARAIRAAHPPAAR